MLAFTLTNFLSFCLTHYFESVWPKREQSWKCDENNIAILKKKIGLREHYRLLSKNWKLEYMNFQFLFCKTLTLSNILK